MPKLLVIDDESSSARALHRALRSILPSDWEVQWEPVPTTGLSILVLDKLVQLCFVDLLLNNGMDGDELIENALKLRPDMRGRIVVCSGAAPSERMEQRLFGDLGCLRVDKPVDFEHLQRVVWSVIHAGTKVSP